ncbi:MAG: right-handed parallel beta-helix repeat-containing protein, partial [Candidatus Sumerlaeota bacterium]
MYRRFLILLTLLIVFTLSTVMAQEYSWQQPHATIRPTGDIQWAPQPFEFVAGDAVRYIDYENGDDNNDGLTMQTPWKHHPWDREAAGKAAEGSGAISYIFKQGVFYRGQLEADESGEEGSPIRLTADPNWGEGAAMLVGSDRLAGKWVKATTVDAPARLPDADKVWALDISALDIIDKNKMTIKYLLPNGRGYYNPPNPSFTGLFQVNADGSASKIHLARDPNWQEGNPNYALDYWYKWDDPVEVTNEEGQKLTTFAAERLKGQAPDYFTGGYFWSSYRHFMGGPISRPMPEVAKMRGREFKFYHPDQGAFVFGTIGGPGPDLRYMIENLPQYLDTENEFYLDFETGMLYLRPAGGVDPNTLDIELVSDLGQISINNQSHIEISNLQFSFTQGSTISVNGNCVDINIHHCKFYDIGQFGIVGGTSSKGPEWMDQVRVADNDFRDIWESAIKFSDGGAFTRNEDYGLLGDFAILRNNIRNSGFRHNGNVQSNVPAIALRCPMTGEIAGNLVYRSWGSGIVVFGGKEGNLGPAYARDRNIPFVRILVHHNETEDTARAVNDYGGLAIWQGGPIYVYGNNIGNSPGHTPNGFMGVRRPINLSYPLYLDGAYKIYSFNNIIWGRTTDKSDPYHNQNSGYFMVFGFLNQFSNNTIYRQGKAVGGSSGNRCDLISNVFSEISDQFLANNRTGDPSLVGGGDDAASGIRGVPSLAFADNIFYGEADAGRLLEQRYDDEKPRYPGIPHDIKAREVEAFQEQMKTFPIRYPELGEAAESNPIVGVESPTLDDGSDADFRLAEGSAAIDRGSTYFVPWGLYGVVGEWHFTENMADPSVVVDYHWYMSEAHFHRHLYERIPTFDLMVNQVEGDLYDSSPSESWAKGAMLFDGKRFARHPDANFREDIKLELVTLGKRLDEVPEDNWIKDKPSGG